MTANRADNENPQTEEDVSDVENQNQNPENDETSRPRLRDSMRSYASSLKDTLAWKIDDRAAQARFDDAAKRAAKESKRDELATAAAALKQAKLDQKAENKEIAQQVRQSDQQLANARKISSAQAKQRQHQEDLQIRQINADAAIQQRQLNAQAQAQKKQLEAETRVQKALMKAETARANQLAKQSKKLAQAQEKHSQAQALLAWAAAAIGTAAVVNQAKNNQNSSQTDEKNQESDDKKSEKNDSKTNQTLQTTEIVDSTKNTEKKDDSSSEENTQIDEEKNKDETNSAPVAEAVAAWVAANEAKKAGLWEKIKNWFKNSRQNAVESNAKKQKKSLFNNVKFVKPSISAGKEKIKNSLDQRAKENKMLREYLSSKVTWLKNWTNIIKSSISKNNQAVKNFFQNFGSKIDWLKNRPKWLKRAYLNSIWKNFNLKISNQISEMKKNANAFSNWVERWTKKVTQWLRKERDNYWKSVEYVANKATKPFQWPKAA